MTGERPVPFITPDLEAPQPASGEAFSDAVTFAFGDPGAGVYGLARAGLADGTASGLAILFRDGETVAVRAEGGVAPAGEGWAGVDAAGVSTAVVEPLARWTVAFDGGPDGGFSLEAEALGEPAVLEPVGGMEGYEHLVRVRGTVRVGGEELQVACLGQRGHSWGKPDWEHMSMARTVSAWLGDDLAVMLSAVRPAKGRSNEHDAEAVVAAVLEGVPVVPSAMAEPRLSTAYDGERHQRRAGFELWPPEGEGDGYARRGAGEVVCGTSLDLGRLRLDCAFFRWRMEGREGVGRYDVLRRT